MIVVIVGAVIGFFIGAVGIGGVALVPLLETLTARDVRTLVQVSMVAFIFSGVVGTIVFARHETIPTRALRPLLVSAALGAFVGAGVLPLVPAHVLRGLIALLLVASSPHTLFAARPRRKPAPPEPRREIAAAPLAALGAACGFGSALTGTGGPVILVPILLFAGTAPLLAIGLAQAIQIPIGLMATAGNAIFGSLDLALAAPLAAAVALGAWIGARQAHRLPPVWLRRLLAATLCLGGVVYAASAWP